MICTTIQNKGFDEIQRILPACEMAEIRLDRCELTIEEIEELFNTELPLVATCRVDEVLQKIAAGREGVGDEDGAVASGAASGAAERRGSGSAAGVAGAAERRGARPNVSAADLARREAVKVCEERLVAAVKAGAAYVDVEDDAPKEMMKRVKAAANESGTIFIISSHDFKGTRAYSDLKNTVERCLRFGADVVKIVTTAFSAEDAKRVMSLYNDFEPADLIAFCMGDAGRHSRIECLRRGAPYSYAALTEADAAAPGQWARDEMMRKVYGGRTFFGLTEAAPEANPFAVRMPASKSFAQRAIVAAALADGTSRLEAYSPCSDSEAALAVAKALGAKVTVETSGTATGIQAATPSAACTTPPADSVSTLTIEGIGARAGAVELHELHVGESGLLTRLMIPLTSQISSADVTLTGEKTLLSRPLKGASEMMSRFGVYLSGETIPLKVSGSLSSGKAEISGRYGSQLISGLLMAEPLGEGSSTIIVREPKSIPYMFITLDVLKQFGINVSSEMAGDREFIENDGDWSHCTEISFRVKGGQAYKGANLTLEGDWSAAANLLVAGAIFGKAEVIGLDTTSLQADLSIMDILMAAGAGLVQVDDNRGPIIARRAPLASFECDATNCPDLFPIISVLAAFCQGTTRIAGVDRLAHKESDRATAIVNMLTQMGVQTEIEDNMLIIEGHSLAQRCLTGTLLRGGKYTSCHDHRMAMALKVAELGADGPIEIDDEACVAKSFPTFFSTFRSAAGEI